MRPSSVLVVEVVLYEQLRCVILIIFICELNTVGRCAAVELPFMYFSRLNEEFVPLQRLRIHTIKCEKLHLIADTVVCESVGSLCQLF